MRFSVAAHFVGISGIGMSALARIMLARGARVSGSSDRATALTARLVAEGATIAIGHDARNLDGCADGTLVVVSTAIAARNPEVLAARSRGFAVVRRGELLATLMHERRGIGIAGTHGKTTTTGMAARVLEAGGLDPTVILGGERVDTGTNARDGAGDWLLTESDESDGSFLALRPEIAVVTNIENDHIGSDAEMPHLILAFETYLARLPTRGVAFVGCDDPRARALAGEERDARTVTYGFAEDADLRATGVRHAGFGSRFGVERDGEPLGEIALAVPGAINVLDALPAVGIGLELGVPFAVIATALAGFRGVRRRFEVLATTERLTVVDDYAHHPTAVAATIAAARASFAGPIVAVFQPHRYTRTQYLKAEFARALRAADAVVLTEIYAASETPIAGVDARSIGEPLAAAGGNVSYAETAQIPEHVLALAPPGALVLMLGAGSITAAAARLAALVEARPPAAVPALAATGPKG